MVSNNKIPILADGIDMRDYAPGMEHEIVDVLQTCFDGKWGDLEQWRWKHTQRPGFDARHIKLFLDNGAVAACFHAGVFPLTLAKGLQARCSLEGDYAVLRQLRGRGLSERAFDALNAQFVADGVVLRIGFTDAPKQEKVYKAKFGHTFVPSINVQYQKVMSTRLLCEKIQHFGDALRRHAGMQRLLRYAPLHVEFRIDGFEPCLLALVAETSVCAPANNKLTPDLCVTLPYRLLTCNRNGKLAALRIFLVSVLTARVRVGGVLRFMRRVLTAVGT